MQYPEYKKISFSKNEEYKFRASLNSYFQNDNSIDDVNLGDIVSIHKVETAPIYRVSLITQYDDRSIIIAEEPSDIEYTPTITDASKIDKWSKIPLSDNFDNFTKFFKIPQSRKTELCPNCKNGKIPCPECNGTGKQKVTVTSTCKYCNGKGYVKKVETKREYYYKDFSSPAIKYNHDGPNRVPWIEESSKTVESKCTRCDNGKVFSEEIRTCSNCNGNKTIKCTRCDGYGTLVKYFQLCQKVYSHTSSRFLYTNSIDLSEFKLLQAFISDDYWNTIDSYIINRTEFDKCNAGSLPLVGNLVTNLFSQVSDSKDKKVALNKLVVDVCPAYYVEYSYNKKLYSCIVFERDFSLFMSESPITDYLKGQRAAVVDNVKKNDISSAWKILNKINKSKHSTLDDKDKLNVIEGRMKDTSRWGVVVGSIISIVLLLPLLIEYFAKVNYVASWTNLVYSFIRPWLDAPPLRAVFALAIVSLFVYHKKIPKWIFLYKSGFVRFLSGLLYGLFLFVISIPIILFANWLGVLQILILVTIIVLGLVIGIVSSIVYFINFIVSLIKYLF